MKMRLDEDVIEAVEYDIRTVLMKAKTGPV